MLVKIKNAKLFELNQDTDTMEETLSGDHLVLEINTIKLGCFKNDELKSKTVILVIGDNTHIETTDPDIIRLVETAPSFSEVMTTISSNRNLFRPIGIG